MPRGRALGPPLPQGVAVVVPAKGEDLLPVTVVPFRLPKEKLADILASTVRSEGPYSPRGANALDTLVELCKAPRRPGKRGPKPAKRWDRVGLRQRHAAYECIRVAGLLERKHAVSADEALERAIMEVADSYGHAVATIRRALAVHGVEARENQRAYIEELRAKHKI